MFPAEPVCLCGATVFDEAFRYDAPPVGEVRFPAAAGPYARTVLRCRTCGHFLSRHRMDLTGLYEGQYLDATYGPHGLRRTFERVTGLAPERSDNEGRARFVLETAAGLLAPDVLAAGPRLLDVGSGTAVFPWRMARAGWRATALDPDARAVRHARDVAGVEAVKRDFARQGAPGTYDVITFNKVLEHVVDPVPMLALAAGCLAPGGFVYLELPDGEAACRQGPGREEFFIDHHHVFSMASMAILAARAGFDLTSARRLIEPSGKYTLRGVAVPAPDSGSPTGTAPSA